MHAFKGFIGKIEKELTSKKDGYESSASRRLDERDIYRYRRQYGVNLGSWFVLEKWISGGPFREAASPASSDYDVARGHHAREILESHWDTWITESDWKWIAERGINSVRIPIGYYHLYSLSPAVVEDTPFQTLGTVFEGAWPRILQAIQTASRYGIGVLVDLHAAPGKQNGDSHSGINGPVEFYKRSNLKRTLYALKILAAALSDTPNVVGIELVNEPKNDDGLWDWYQSTINSIRSEIGADLPLYIGDAWNTYQYAALVEQREDFVVVDHHLYRCFTQQDQQLAGEEHAAAMPPKHLVDCFQKTRGNLVVAEFSAALNPNSMRSPEAGEQDRQRRVFSRAELECFRHYCAGWWFWTYKKDGWDAGWSLRDTVRAEIMPNWVGIRRQDGKPNDTNRRDAECANALTSHQNYWAQYKSEHGYEHWRLEQGFKQGWDDAFMFLSFSPQSLVDNSVSELGFVGQWLKRRTAEHVADKGKSKSLWEFEHGFRQGLQAATRCFLGT
ncbi:glycoside hydrolase family 5 protein [Sphaerobolus stellatus SS14]|nr:glycoside hydrolase family 5 protein [Sphaerobolus stellatus SS14]